MPRLLLGGHTTCKFCKSIDVRRWRREGLLGPGQQFLLSWTCDGEPTDRANVRTKHDAVVLTNGVRSLLAKEWKPIEQRVPSHGQTATLVAAVRGLFVPFAPAADTAGGGSQCCTSLANCSHAEAITGWLTRASNKA
jgi:hypothetical protein